MSELRAKLLLVRLVQLRDCLRSSVQSGLAHRSAVDRHPLCFQHRLYAILRRNLRKDRTDYCILDTLYAGIFSKFNFN